MQFSTILALAAAAAAAPVAEQKSSSETFTLISSHSGDASVHLQPINASGQRFYIGKPTSTFCPDTIKKMNACPAGTTTALGINKPNKTLYMSAEVPGGQQGYVAPDGALGYTIAHSASIPEGSVQTPFSLKAFGNGSELSSFVGPDGQSFVACPKGNGVFQIYDAAHKGFKETGCTGVGLVASPAKGPAAWQYN